MERKLRYAWWFVLIGLVIVAIWKLFLPHGSNAYLQKTVSSREIVVYVAGAVEKPGLVHLAPDARLDDALKLVSPLPEADLESMNPAEKLKDEQKVFVPHKSILLSPESTVVGNPINVVGSVNPASIGGKININTAGAAELDKLPGVGPALAERILQYRTEHGPFARPEDLENVSGIGTKTYEKMASQVTVGP
ncbi:helix-hairpin-helix domain-containing protein [Desulfosporosinus sp. OT]|uniref:helix-hairpin-helix domain-containing protein n=1 Tax=Desulfosporosinus sp. OT TaxID=913865 RepID=UPI000223A633|nr:helix-hairpin-helix domain-containing protein [Desulfosporosinus sp. OT]EGW37892.1 competence ComEA helix-hairpin-helix repeat region domain protein [Desulfosporosinus sp. OT]